VLLSSEAAAKVGFVRLTVGSFPSKRVAAGGVRPRASPIAPLPGYSQIIARLRLSPSGSDTSHNLFAVVKVKKGFWFVNREKNAAFTLIELLVVVGIIGILAAMLLPVLAQTREKGKAARCHSNLHQLAYAALMYAEDNRETFIGFWTGIDRKMLLYPYTASGKNNAQLDPNQLWHCPSVTLTNQASYGFSSSLNFVRLASIVRADDVVMACDAGVNSAGAPITATHCMSPAKAVNAINGRPNPRHSKGVLVAWMDGHVSWMRMQMPFYSDPSTWGNGITDPANPNYTDHQWAPH
jgi:prepilin-type N-terminal cleavage/methylation domain-containing protein/prepilin-type processing-associated H-X9-DG protein